MVFVIATSLIFHGATPKSIWHCRQQLRNHEEKAEIGNAVFTLAQRQGAEEASRRLTTIRYTL
jgi:hypothetical protein